MENNDNKVVDAQIIDAVATPDEPKLAQPSKVKLAMLLITTSLVIKLLASAWNLMHADSLIATAVSKLPPDTKNIETVQSAIKWTFYLGLTVGAAVSIILFIIYMLGIRRRKSWARMMYLILSGISFLGIIYQIYKLTSDFSLVSLFAIIGALLGTAAAVCLLLPESVEWFENN